MRLRDLLLKRLLHVLVIASALLALAVAAYDFQKKGRIGESCLQGCRSGQCYSPRGLHLSPSYCSTECTPGGEPCPSGFHCASAEGAGSGLCRKDPSGEFGDRCWLPEECKDGHCVEMRDNGPPGKDFRLSVCSRPCRDASDCAEGWDCGDVRGVRLCSPTAMF